MTRSGSPCGACKFLRRKCLKGCVFAPYFCHDQGASHFAAIHRVFGASNASKLLTQLPMKDRCEAVLTISYEAQARIQDPIFGCVSHIFLLQQQVVNLQRQLETKKQALQSIMATGYQTIQNPNHYRDIYSQHLQEPQDLLHHQTISNYQNGSLKTEHYSDQERIMTSSCNQMGTGTTPLNRAYGDTTATSYYNNSSCGFGEELKSILILDEKFSINFGFDQHLNPSDQYYHGGNDVLSRIFKNNF